VERNPARWVACGASALLTGAYLAFVPAGKLAHIDHLGFLETLRRMRGGQGYYEAFRDTYWADWGVRLGGPRSYRLPYLFELLQFVPPGLLLGLFALVVVIGTSVLLADGGPRPFAALPVTLFLLVAGRNPRIGDGIELWMLVELWAVPLLALSYWGWRKDRPWAAALGAAGAALVRELAAPVVLLGLVLAWRRREPLRPWLVAAAVTVAGLALHVVLALGVGSREGTEATLLGTGTPPRSVVAMLLFGWPLGLGLVPWVLAGIHVVRHRLVAPVSALLVVPLLGLAVDRPYWGILATPFVLLWAGELVGDVVAERAARPTPQPTMDGCSDPRPAPSPMRPAPTSSRTPTAG
jgi:hypothetical protein